MKSTLVWILPFLIDISYADACNMTIKVTETETNLTSPGYPMPYSYMENCWWKLESSSADRLIGVQVALLDMEWTPNCTYDNLTFYDGVNVFAPVLSRQCGDSGRNVVSTGSELFITFKSDGSRIRDGFFLKIVEIDKDLISNGCNLQFVATPDSQTFKFPKHFRFLSGNCTWTITADNENDTIDINIKPTSFQGLNLIDCQKNEFTFYDGNSTKDQEIISLYCPRYPGPLLRSSQNVMTVVFKAGSLINTEFEMNYGSAPEHNCSRTIVATTITTYISSPGSPDAYYNNLNCTILILSVTSYIRIEILSVDIEGSFPECDNDSLTFYSDATMYNKQLTLCGSPAPRTLYSVGSVMPVQFLTNSETVSQGYRLAVTSVLQAPHYTNCGNTSLIATSEPQYLTSPNYPLVYQNHDKCTWNITAAHPGMMIRFVLMDTDIESPGRSDGGCTYDSLKAYNGNTNISPFMTVCGISRPVAQSNGSHVVLVFMADGTTVGKGFKLNYFETNETYTCGGHLNATSAEQWITSPNWPGNYPDNQNCRWSVQAPGNMNIKLSATIFDVESPSDCAYDYVMIYDGLGSTPAYTAKLCGSNLYTYLSIGNSLTMLFHSDHSQTRRGFQYMVLAGHFATYTTRTTEVNAHYFESALTSPNYPFYYPTNADVTWRIDTIEANNRVNVKFDTSSGQNSPSCFQNYVEVFDGYSDSASSLGKFCGYDTSTKTSTGRYMFLKFKSGSESGPGFQLLYTKEYHYTSDEQSYKHVAPIIGGLVAGISFIFIIIIVISRISSRRKQGPTVRTVQQTNMYTIRPVESPTPATSLPPPSYTVATGGDGTNNNPPTYSEVAHQNKSDS